MADSTGSAPPDLTVGLPPSSLASCGALLGRVGEDEVLLARAGDRFFAVGAYCTHYHVMQTAATTAHRRIETSAASAEGSISILRRLLSDPVPAQENQPGEQRAIHSYDPGHMT
jgi:hypothetical protein